MAGHAGRPRMEFRRSSQHGAMQGWLEKKGSSGWQSWKKRFFLIQDGALAYSDGPGKPVAVGKEFSLAGAIVVSTAGGGEFVVSTTAGGGEEKKMLLRSTNGPSDAAAWVAAIESTPGTAAEVKTRQEREAMAEAERVAAEEKAASEMAVLEAKAAAERKAAEDAAAKKTAEDDAAAEAEAAAEAAAASDSLLRALPGEEDGPDDRGMVRVERAMTCTVDANGNKVLDGYLTKAGEGRLSASRRRFFVLHDCNSLTYGSGPPGVKGSKEINTIQLNSMTLSKHASKELTFELTSYAVALDTMSLEEQKKKARTYALTVDKGKQEEFDAWWSALSQVVHCDDPPFKREASAGGDEGGPAAEGGSVSTTAGGGPAYIL